MLGCILAKIFSDGSDTRNFLEELGFRIYSETEFYYHAHIPDGFRKISQNVHTTMFIDHQGDGIFYLYHSRNLQSRPYIKII